MAIALLLVTFGIGALWIGTLGAILWEADRWMFRDVSPWAMPLFIVLWILMLIWEGVTDAH